MNYQIKSLTLKTKFENSLNKLLLVNIIIAIIIIIYIFIFLLLLLLLNQKRKRDIISNLWITQNKKKHFWESAAHWNSYQQLHKYIHQWKFVNKVTLYPVSEVTCIWVLYMFRKWRFYTFLVTTQKSSCSSLVYFRQPLPCSNDCSCSLFICSCISCSPKERSPSTTVLV
jgi:hypothetical protein